MTPAEEENLRNGKWRDVMRILAVAGAPGVGKSTLFAQLIPLLGERLGTARHGLMDYLLVGRTAVLGVYEDGDAFGGTDKLSMAVQPHAEDFIARAAAGEFRGVDAVALEGDRLCTSKFLTLCAAAGELRFIVLEADPAILQARRDERSFLVGKEQDPTWLRGRETKVEELARTQGGERHRVDAPEDTVELAQHLSGWLAGTIKVELKQPQRLF
jgi:hypothetical protein